MPWLPWALYALALICFAVVFRTHSMGLAFLCLLIALGASLWATLMLASARIQSRARDESQLLGPDELRRIRERATGTTPVSGATASDTGRVKSSGDRDVSDAGGGTFADGGGGD